MKRLATVLTMVLLVGAAAAAAQQPSVSIQDGKVETRAATSIDREIAGVAGSDPVWIAWREPMIDGKRDSCSRYSDFDHPLSIRGELLDGDWNNGQWHVPEIAPPQGPVALEGGTTLVVFARIVDKRVERLRTLSDDCPVDANGRTVVMLTGITPAESIRFLESQTHPDFATRTRNGAQNLMNDAIAAVALHRDPAADPVLDRLAADPNSDVRRQAIASLGSARGAHGFATLRTLLGTERTRDVRAALARAIGQTRQPETADVLLGLLRDDPDPSVRAEAAYYLPQRGGDRVIAEVVRLAGQDRDDSVKRRALSGIALLPPDTSVPALIQIARSNDNVTLRKQAVSELSRSKDPRALAYLEEIIKR